MSRATYEQMCEWLALRRAHADPAEMSVLDAIEARVDAYEDRPSWDDDSDPDYEPTPRAAGAFGGPTPSGEAIAEERRVTEDAVAPLRAIEGVTDVEVLIERGDTTYTEIRWLHCGKPHGLKGAFGSGVHVARQVLLCARALDAREALAKEGRR